MSLELPRCSPFDSDKIIRVIGIDPGINTLGISVLEKDAESGEIALAWSSTVKSNRFSKIHSDIATDSGERFARLHGYKCLLVDFFNNWKPDVVICEGNYMGSYPSAYSALTEMVLIVRIAAMDYRANLSVDVVEPSIVKKTLGISGKSGDKDLMKEAVSKLNLIFYQPQKIDDLDEHAIDSIAVGYKGVLDLGNSTT